MSAITLEADALEIQSLGVWEDGLADGDVQKSTIISGITPTVPWTREIHRLGER